MENNVKVPPHLRSATKKWFRSVLADYELDAHHIHLLTLAAEALDQSQTAREVLDRDGQTFTDRFGQPKERPEVGILNNARIAFARLIRELCLDVDSPPDAPRMRGRPTMVRGADDAGTKTQIKGPPRRIEGLVDVVPVWL